MTWWFDQEVIIDHNSDDGDQMAEMEKCILCPRLIRRLQLLFKEDLEWNGMKKLQVISLYCQINIIQTLLPPKKNIFFADFQF